MTTQPAQSSKLAHAIPVPALVVFRGIGQVIFQENALTGVSFVLGIALSSPLMAVGIVVGAAIGTAVARLLKFDESEWNAGIYGFNAALVGIATLFFFQPGVVSIGLLLVGCVVATLLTRWMRLQVPFPTYTSPFIVTTWVIFFLGSALGASRHPPGESAESALPGAIHVLEATAHGIGQVMFQASIWTGLLFLVGIAISDRRHAAWVLLGSVLGMLVGGYHAAAATRALDPEMLIDRAQFENVLLGLYGYNATLVAVALSLWRRSLIPPILGVLVSVPLTELVPKLGLPALTAPFVLAAWLVMALGWLEGKFFKDRAASGL
ncbi:MAG: urea transporter [Planctomycetales bacterium]